MYPAKIFLLAAVSLPLGVATGCANPGPPRPPSLHLPQTAKNLTAERVGRHVDLAWMTSATTTEGETLRGTITAVVCRRDDVLSPGSSACNPLTRKPVSSGLTQTSVDLPPALLTGSPSLIGFSVELLNSHGRSAGLSTPAYVASGEAPAAASPIQVAALRNAVQITWQPVPGDAPVRLSRALIPSSVAKPGQNSKPAANTTPPLAALNLPGAGSDPGGMIDRGIHDGDTLTYIAQRVRNVIFPSPPASVSASSKHQAAPQPATLSVELRGEPSPPVTFVFHDTIPPAAPTGLAAIPGGGFGAPASIDLSWEPGAEPDLTGYNLYRAENGGEFIRLNPEPMPGTAFRDLAVKTGPTYAYRVTAIDQRRNESAPSVPLTQQLNP